MTLHQKMFGMILRSPADEGSDLGGGDRGDNFTGDGEDEVVDEVVNEVEETLEDDEAGDDKTEDEDSGAAERDEKGRFAKKADEPRIPKARFDEAVNKERERVSALERQIAELQATQSQIKRRDTNSEIEAEIDQLEAARSSALLEGDGDKASEIARLIRAKERQIITGESQVMSAQAKEQAREEIRMELTVDKIEIEFPVLNPDSEEYDEDLVELVLSKQRSLMQKEGIPSSKALAKAAGIVMLRFGAKPAEDAPTKGLKTGVDDRKAAQVKKNLAVAKKQPPSLKDSGLDSDKMGSKALDLKNISFEEFSALPESTKAKARGDFL